MHDFFVYDGKSVHVEDSSGTQCGDYVIKLCEFLPSNQNFILFFDNYFTTLALQVKLLGRQIYSVGTIRQNRLDGVRLPSEAQLKLEGRGTFVSFHDKEDGLTLTRWFDNRVVTLLSTVFAVEPLHSVSRWDRKSKRPIKVPCPEVISQYNKHMGGVDKFDMLMACYRFPHKATKWYRRLFHWVLSAAVVNSWLHYKRHAKSANIPSKEWLDLLNFSISIAKALLQTRKRGRPSNLNGSAIQNSSLDSTLRPSNTEEHLPVKVDRKGRKRCTRCSMSASTFCSTCNVFLCFVIDRNCFSEYHSA